jgi:hypothetical protein
MGAHEFRKSHHNVRNRLLAWSVLGLRGGGAPGAAHPLSLPLVANVALTTDEEGGSARPEIVATSNRVFVVYLGNIASGSDRSFFVKIYDSDLKSLIATKTLVQTTVDYGGPTDIRVASDGQYLYAFYETFSSETTTTYLWGAKYALSDTFDLVVSTLTPITSGTPLAIPPDGHELLDDPAPLVGQDSIFVVTRYDNFLSKAENTIYHVREFDKALVPIREFDLDLSNAAVGRGRVASLLSWNGNIYIALATTVPSVVVDEAYDDGALSDIVLVRMTQDWTYDPGSDVFVLSAEPDDRENYVTGLEADSSYFYITYKQTVGSPDAGEHRAWIKIFDHSFNRVHAELVKSVPWSTAGAAVLVRPSLEVAGTTIYSGQSGSQTLGAGNAEIYVYDVK